MKSVDSGTVEYLKDIQTSKIDGLISKATTVEPTDKLAQVISKISKNDKFDVFL
ncbi:MAG: hypothetical protein HKM23_05750 [Nitrosopumilus sp.]|nr:hypothetical protein [Nitrosopumilus sp.]NNL58684.1 hypothetical protein [Nitrosopumilus sp.]